MAQAPRIFWRGALTLGTILGFLLSAALREPAMALLGWSGIRRRQARTAALSRWSRFLLDALGFSIDCRSARALRAEGALFVSNHLSFWDALAIAALGSPVFVTSVEVRETPVLGWLCRAAGCIFVERRNRARITEERGEVTRALREGASVVLFPEGTSSNGATVLPFKRSFFSSAIAAGRDVVPLCINYREIDGKRLDATNRDLVFYYGDQDFATQLGHALRLRSVRIEIHVLAPIPTQTDKTDREWLTLSAREAIVSHFDPVGEPPGVTV